MSTVLCKKYNAANSTQFCEHRCEEYFVLTKQSYPEIFYANNFLKLSLTDFQG